MFIINVFQRLVDTFFSRIDFNPGQNIPKFLRLHCATLDWSPNVGNYFLKCVHLLTSKCL